MSGSIKRCTEEPQKLPLERIEAWDFGPVVPEAYREYKQFGSGDIPTVSYIVDFDEENIWESKVRKYKDDVVSSADKELIEAVVDIYEYIGIDKRTDPQCGNKNVYF